MNIVEPLIRDTIKINQDKGGQTVDKKVNGSYSGSNRAFRQKSPRIGHFHYEVMRQRFYENESFMISGSYF